MNGNAEFDECARRGGKGGRKRRVGVEGEERAPKMDLLKDEEESLPPWWSQDPQLATCWTKAEKSMVISLNV